jgi:hypothetical protein
MEAHRELLSNARSQPVGVFSASHTLILSRREADERPLHSLNRDSSLQGQSGSRDSMTCVMEEFSYHTCHFFGFQGHRRRLFVA